ncbi:MAG: efflux RND transporter periplasmic adaptor subunit [Chitinophagales bacterium]|nr:efflux RND transporter periplasmic adaptor subunit [Chitinophagales bacterium]
MKVYYFAFAFLAAIASCKDSGKNSAGLKANKEKLTSLKKEQKKIGDEIAALEGMIAKEEGRPTAVTTKRVTLASPVEGSFNHYIDVQGDVKCEENIAVTSDMGGIVTKVLVKEGQQVSQGQVLATTDNSILLKSIDEIDEQLNLAKSVYEKQKRLWDQGIGSQIQMMQAETNKNALERKKLTIYSQMEKTKIKAPVGGVVDKLFVKVGEMAAPGFPAVRVVNLNQLKIEAEVPETYSGKVKHGENVKVELPALNKTINARVRAISQVINTQNRSFTTIIDIKNDGTIKPNMVAKIMLNDFSINKAITIESKLLQQHDGKDFIYIAEMDSATKKTYAKKREIVLGKSYNGLSQIVSGLSKGDRLINDGFRDVLEGDEIEF